MRLTLDKHISYIFEEESQNCHSAKGKVIFNNYLINLVKYNK